MAAPRQAREQDLWTYNTASISQETLIHDSSSWLLQSASSTVVFHQRCSGTTLGALPTAVHTNCYKGAMGTWCSWAGCRCSYLGNQSTHAAGRPAAHGRNHKMSHPLPPLNFCSRRTITAQCAATIAPTWRCTRGCTIAASAWILILSDSSGRHIKGQSPSKLPQLAVLGIAL